MVNLSLVSDKFHRRVSVAGKAQRVIEQIGNPKNEVAHQTPARFKHSVTDEDWHYGNGHVEITIGLRVAMATTSVHAVCGPPAFPNAHY